MKESCSLSRPDDLAIGSISSRRLLTKCPTSSAWPYGIWTLSHPDDLAIDSISSGWLMANVRCPPDDIRSFPKSPGWHNVSWTVCHPDEIAPGRISSGWLMTNARCHPDDFFSVSHPDDLWTLQDVTRMTYDVALCHPDEITNLIPQSSGWPSYSQYLIRMTYRHCRTSSGWLTV